MDLEAKVTHDSGSTAIRSNGGLQRLFCPIPRRATSFYGVGGASAEKVNLQVVDLHGIDSSTSYKYTCMTFATNMFNQTMLWGTSKALCSPSTMGCDPSGTSASWTGSGDMTLQAPSNLSSLFTVNFGVICDLGPQSTLTYLEASVVPN